MQPHEPTTALLFVHSIEGRGPNNVFNLTLITPQAIEILLGQQRRFTHDALRTNPQSEVSSYSFQIVAQHFALYDLRDMA